MTNVGRRRARAREPRQPEGVRYIGPPTVVALECDYGYSSPLLNRSPGVGGVSQLSPVELGLSDDLAQRLMSWLGRMPSWNSEGGDPEWDNEGLALAQDLQRELGAEITVLHRDEPVIERRRR